jgi:hypothetical protein
MEGTVFSSPLLINYYLISNYNKKVGIRMSLK